MNACGFLKFGTFSSDRDEQGMRLLRSGGSVQAIMHALDHHGPDVFLAAGHSLSDQNALAELQGFLEKSRWPGIVFVEVADDGDTLPLLTATGWRLPEHCLYAWAGGPKWKRLGRQFFATSDQAKDNVADRVGCFTKSLGDRVVEWRGLRFGGLICGEINAVKGRNAVAAIRPEIESWLRSLDVIVNPTHDLMGNAGTLIAKRRWLSKGGRLYLSASNWNSRPKTRRNGVKTRQKRTARTLHTIYHDGEDLTSKSVWHKAPDYEYRETCLSFAPVRKRFVDQ